MARGPAVPPEGSASAGDSSATCQGSPAGTPPSVAWNFMTLAVRDTRGVMPESARCDHERSNMRAVGESIGRQFGEPRLVAVEVAAAERIEPEPNQPST